MKRFLKLTILLSITCSMFIGCAQMAATRVTPEPTTTTSTITITHITPWYKAIPKNNTPESQIEPYIVKQVKIHADNNFTVVRRIFLTTNVVIDELGNIVEGSDIITYDMLIREAMRHGADDIVNLVIEVEDTQRITTTSSTSEVGGVRGRTSSRQSQSQIKRRTITYKATALAIKYK